MATLRILLTVKALGLKQGMISSVAPLQKLRFRRQMPCEWTSVSETSSWRVEEVAMMVGLP